MEIQGKLRTPLMALIGVIAVFQFLSVKHGQSWGDDWAQYVAHARNIAEGRPYSSTGYIFNADQPIAPPNYPPGFPLMLAPIYGLRGLDLDALKIPAIVSLIAAIGLFALIVAEWEGAPTALATTALLGFHPFFRNFKNEILSDLPFLFVLLLALWMSEKALMSRSENRNKIWLGVAIGFAWWCAYALRTVGLVLPASAVLLTVARRKPDSRIVIALAVFCILAALQALTLQGPADYLIQFSYRPELIHDRARNYMADLRTLIDPRLGSTFIALEFWFLTALSAAGIFRVWRRGHHLPIVFSLLYTALVLVWPFHEGLRMLIPLIPFYFLGIVVGVGMLTERIGPLRYVVTTAACLAAAGIYARQYTFVDTGEVPGVESADARGLFNFIRGSTSRQSVFIFKKPRALALYTGRRASVYSTRMVSDPWTYVSRIHATHVVTIRRSAQDSLYLRTLEQNRHSSAKRLYSNGHFEVYELYAGQ
jgi:hypothetical protein